MRLQHESVTLPSDRKFGIFSSFLFSLAALYFFIKKNVLIYYLTGGVAITLAFLTILLPLSLATLNSAWYKLGLLLGRIVNPIVLGVIFFLLLTPIAVLMRWQGRDALRLRKSSNRDSYWIHRDPEGLKPESFKNQF